MYAIFKFYIAILIAPPPPPPSEKWIDAPSDSEWDYENQNAWCII